MADYELVAGTVLQFPHVSQLSDEFSTQGSETHSSQARDTDNTVGCDPWLYHQLHRNYCQ